MKLKNITLSLIVVSLICFIVSMYERSQYIDTDSSDIVLYYSFEIIYELSFILFFCILYAKQK